ncbi:CD9 antigen isoform X2 [Lepeophtheirus salmonis]|uniref:Tetraspanin n=2 Tax=Lepeophtheirus salmonis TaxID=72036 RepID=A0A0K2T0A2_LEPSM|nr:CD151 antigen-like isoform X2 [Lepeophtheirus salmonis]
MTLRGCFGCLKFLVFVANFLFWCLGLGVMAVSLWLLFDAKLYLQSLGSHRVDYFIGTYIILGVGAVITLVGFLGCCGAWKESPWMLGTFFVFLVFILVAEFGACILVYFKEAPYQGVIENSVKATVMKKYHQNSTATTQTFDLIQQGLECCGAEGPSDWSISIFNGYIENNAPEIGIPRSLGDPRDKLGRNFNLPQSCCVDIKSNDCLTAITGADYKALRAEDVFTEGCSNKMVSFVEEHVIYLLAMVAGVLVIQVVGMIFSLCLCCALKRIEDFKA